MPVVVPSIVSDVRGISADTDVFLGLQGLRMDG